MIIKQFAEVLQELRHDRGLSQEKLEEMSELHDRYISFLERGLRKPTIVTIFKLSKALGIHPYELVKLVEDKVIENNQ